MATGSRIVDIKRKQRQLILLVAGAQRKESACQSALWKICWPEVYRACTHVLGEGLAANETAAEVLSDFVLNHIQRLSNPSSAITYLQLAAVRRSLKVRHRMNRSASFDMDSLLDEPEVNSQEQAENRVLLPRLEHCLGELTPKAQQVLKLRFVKGLANEKIGELLGGSKQYVGQLIRKSLVALRQCLERAHSKEDVHAPL